LVNKTVTGSSMENKTVENERFEIIRPFAKTLQGQIFAALDKRTRQYAAIKEANKKFVSSKLTRDNHQCNENFLEEREILTFLSNQPDCHTGIVRMLDEWEDENCYYFAMEYCSGDFLKFILNMHAAQKRSNQLQSQQQPSNEPNEVIKTVSEIFAQLVNCVSWMHDKGVYHLNLNVENVMISHLKTKIIDFGVAKRSTNGSFMNNKVVGKLGYMAPEVFARKNYDGRAADIWSLGVILFMMLVGRSLYRSPSSSCPIFRMIIAGNLREVLKTYKRLGCVSEDALDLLTKIFRYEDDRISMRDLQNHPFVQQSQKVDISGQILKLDKEAKNDDLANNVDQKSNANM